MSDLLRLTSSAANAAVKSRSCSLALKTGDALLHAMIDPRPHLLCRRSRCHRHLLAVTNES
jgi:hypothetical protein